MIKRRDRMAVTCPHCDAPYELTDAITDAATAAWYAKTKDLTDRERERVPMKVPCPHCGQGSTFTDLIGDNIENFHHTARTKKAHKKTT